MNRALAERIVELEPDSPVGAWSNALSLPKDGITPPVQNQCGSVHWNGVLRETEGIDRAIGQLTHTENAGGISQTDEACDERPNVIPLSGTWKIRDLVRDLEGLLPLVRALAHLCRIVGDFGDAREPISAANIAYLGKKFAQCGAEIEQSGQFFSAYTQQSSRSFLSVEEARDLKDIGRLRHFASILEEENDFSGRLYTPPLIATLMEVSADTVLRCIYKMEKNWNDREKRESQSIRETVRNPDKELKRKRRTRGRRKLEESTFGKKLKRSNAIIRLCPLFA